MAGPGTVALPGARIPKPASDSGLRTAGAPRPAAEPVPRAPAPEALEALTVLLANGDDLEEIRRIVRGSGGRTLEFRVLDPRERREAFAPHRARSGLRAEVSRGWELAVRIPRRAVPGLVAALERRPGRLVLERRPAPPAERDRPSREQSLRITILR